MSSLTKSELIKVIGGTFDVNVADRYGAIADSSTDCAAGLMAMQAELSGANKAHFRLNFPAPTIAGGSLLSSNNRYLFGIQSFTFNGNNSRISTSYSGSDGILGRSIWVGNMFQTNVLTYVGTSTWCPMYRINTVAAGSLTITCKYIADAANFSAGQRFLLYGIDNTGFGYPPGTRSEWKTIQSVNTGTGVITLTMPLEYSWNAETWDVPFETFGTGFQVGKPRIALLDRSGNAGQYCRYAEFNDVTFGRSTNALAGTGALVFAAEKVETSNCLAEDFLWPSENIDFNMDRVIINELSEFDKLVGNIYCNRVDFKKQVTGGSNCKNITIENSQSAQAMQPDCSNHLIIRNTSIRADTLPDTGTAAFSSQGAHNSANRVTIEGLKFTSTASNAAVAHIDKFAFNTISIPAVSGTNIVLPFTTYSTNTNFNVVRSLREGVTRLFKDDGTKGGTVTSMYFDFTYNPTTKTGTITSTTSSAAIVGSGTSFTTQFVSGNYITSGGVYLGTVLSVTDNTHLTLYDPAEAAVTGAAYALAQGAFVVVGDWAAPVAAETWVWCYVKDVQDLGSHQVLDGKFLYDVSSQRWSGNTKKLPPYECHLSQDDFLYTGGRERQTPSNFRIKSISVNVIKAYSGTDTAAKAEIYVLPSFDQLLTINLKTVGQRSLTQFQSFPSTPVTGDTYGISFIANFMKSIDLVTNGSSGGISNLTAATKPQFDIIIEYYTF